MGHTHARLRIAVEPTVCPGPRFHVGPLPDFAHVKHNLGLRKVVTADELLDALAADAEHAPDLSRAHKVMHVRNHSQHATCLLTSGQEYGRLVL